MAIDKSKLDPLFGNHAGESETVTFLFGHTSDELTIAARTRSRDSLRAASGKPRSEYIGIPSAISTSTVTIFPESPRRATLVVVPRLTVDFRDIRGYEIHL